LPVVPLFGPPNIQKLIDKQDLKGLAKALADGDQSIRDQAANGLIQLSNPASVPFVIDVVRAHQEDAVINAGVHVLTQMSDQSVPTLKARLNSGPLDERAGYAGLLGRLGAPGLDALLETSRNSESGMRAVAAMGLGLVDAAPAHARLAEMVASDDSMDARGYAGFAMATHKVAGAYDTLIAQLDNEDPANRGIAATNLGVLGDRRAIERLEELARSDQDQRVRDAATRAASELQVASAG
jgi:HEAT repeat protein